MRQPSHLAHENALRVVLVECPSLNRAPRTLGNPCVCHIERRGCPQERTKRLDPAPVFTRSARDTPSPPGDHGPTV